MNHNYLRILAVFNFLLLAWRCFTSYQNHLAETPSASHVEYSYRGADYPLNLPLDISSDPVAMTLHETVHFQLNATDPISQKDWDMFILAPKEAGRMRLGPDHRLFTLTFWHQFHCLWSIQRALNDRNDTYGASAHVHHCLNYLRQTLLCLAADSLEFGDFMQKDFVNDRVGDTLVCNDWQKVYTAMDANYQSWTEWANEWN